MPIYVTVMQAQLDELRHVARTRRLRVMEGVAFALESEGVYHVFTSRPPYRPAGSPVPAFFVMSEKSRIPDDAEATLRQMGATEATPVVVVDILGSDAPAAYLGAKRGAECVLHVIAPQKDAASRSKGILESQMLAERCAFIVGVGSFGSTAAVELAKAGVGKFILVDPDRLEPGNIMRHHCGVADIGRYKTHAVRDAILAKNPLAQVETHEFDVNTQMDFIRESARASDVLICLTDESRSRFNCNSSVVAAGRPAIFGRAITRAAGGDVFRYRPGGPCLACLFSQGISAGDDEVSNARQAEAQTPDYAPEGYDAALVQPGLSVDISPIVQMVVKLALIEMAPHGVPQWESLREDLAAPFYIWANRRDELYKDWKPMQYFFNQSSIMRWYGTRVPRDGECMTCAMT